MIKTDFFKVGQEAIYTIWSEVMNNESNPQLHKCIVESIFDGKIIVKDGFNQFTFEDWDPRYYDPSDFECLSTHDGFESRCLFLSEQTAKDYYDKEYISKSLNNSHFFGNLSIEQLRAIKDIIEQSTNKFFK